MQQIDQIQECKARTLWELQGYKITLNSEQNWMTNKT